MSPPPPGARRSPGSAPLPEGAGVARGLGRGSLARQAARPGEASVFGGRGAALRKLGTALLALAIFIFAIELLKAGAGAIAPVARDVFRVSQPGNALGFGWVLSYLVLSGSPIAATALGLFAAGVLDDLGAYMMIAGSRLGAAFIVLFIGFVYAVRGRHRQHGRISMDAGVMSLLVTYTIYGPGILLGLLLLESGALAPYALTTPPGVLDLLDASFGAAADFLAARAPHAGLVFLAGLGAVLLAFKLFDSALPDIRKRAGKLGRMAERIYRPSVMFAFGFVVTLLTLSVSVSLSLLVPLTVKGIVRRENLIPYIMGANVSTFIDTLVASVVVGGAAAFTVVLAEMGGVAIVSLVVIVFAYNAYEESIYRLSRAVLASKARLGLFVTVILICPLLLLLL